MCRLRRLRDRCDSDCDTTTPLPFRPDGRDGCVGSYPGEDDDAAVCGQGEGLVRQIDTPLSASGETPGRRPGKPVESRAVTQPHADRRAIEVEDDHGRRLAAGAGAKVCQALAIMVGAEQEE